MSLTLRGLARRRASKQGRARRKVLKTRQPSLEPLEGRELLSHTPHALPAIQARHAARLAAQTAGGPQPSGYHEIQNVVYSKDGQKLDLYIPNGPAPPGGREAVVAFPGGGWKWASKTEYGSHVSALASYGFVVAVADYTYSTGAPGTRVWPIDFQDVQNAVRWVRGNADRLGIDPNKIAAEGVSSGSYMANMLGTYPDGPVSAESLPPNPIGPGTPDGISARVQAVVDFYGPTDMTALYKDEPRTRPDIISFLGGTPDQFPARYQAASPIQLVSPDDPPFFIVQGTGDRAVPVNQSYMLDSALTNAHVPHRMIILNGISHGFEFKLGALNLLPDVVTFLNQALNHQPLTTSPNP
ncbi:MAG TPA: alpha/beta hydrolase [Isosphaeraceae bacterium]|jgi:acetyl esterase/lipase|nr:alpha/beta hydrolase [Isosphaeraceae bacterium]